MPKNPTNSDLFKELKSMQASLSKMDGRVESLEMWKVATDASNAAVEKYKRDKFRSSEEKTKMEILQALLPFLIALTALVYGIITYLGRLK